MNQEELKVFLEQGRKVKVNRQSVAGWRVCFSRHRLGVSQEEVQKKPQLGTTQ
jgi:hypothetical protein